MAPAANTLCEMQGGQIVVTDYKVVSRLTHLVAGLISVKLVVDVAKEFVDLQS